MDFKLSEEQQLIKQSMEEVASGSEKTDSHELLKNLADMGFIGIFYPEAVGGSDSDFMSFAVNVETLAKVSASHALALTIQGIQIAYPLFKWGSDAIQSAYLQLVNSGEKTGAYAYSEQGLGEDQLEINATAEHHEGLYVINGSKSFVLNAEHSDFFIVFACTGDLLSAFVIDRDAQGITIDPPYRKMGLDGLSAATVHFKNVSVPETHLLGHEGDGEAIFGQTNELLNIGLAATSIGLSQKAEEKSIAYGKQRFQFGRPVIAFEALQEKIGKMSVNIEAARLLMYKAAADVDNGASFTESSSVARYFALETGIVNCREAIQVHGGYGYTRDLGIEVLYRDMQGLMAVESQNKPLIFTIAAKVIEA
ncbi:MAG: acyl-CoA dehydrogenase family protein [Sporolactobacillus sp.]